MGAAQGKTASRPRTICGLLDQVSIGVEDMRKDFHLRPNGEERFFSAV